MANAVPRYSFFFSILQEKKLIASELVVDKGKKWALWANLQNVDAVE